MVSSITTKYCVATFIYFDQESETVCKSTKKFGCILNKTAFFGSVRTTTSARTMMTIFYPSISKQSFLFFFCWTSVLGPLLCASSQTSWNVNDHIIKSRDDDICSWFTVKPPRHIPAYEMCLRSDSDLLSRWVRIEGCWTECNALLDLWDSRIASKHLFLDVGANIGSCSFLMAAYGAHVMAFEPQPSNLFHFKNSLTRFNFSTQIELFPFGLSNISTSSIMYYDTGNDGNSVVGKRVSDSGRKFDSDNMKNFTINLERLDDVILKITGHYPIIALLKLDIQGSETNFFKGAEKLLRKRKIKIIKSEVAPRWLEAHGSSAREFCELLINHGYLIESALDRKRMTVDKCASLRSHIDIVARLANRDSVSSNDKNKIKVL